MPKLEAFGEIAGTVEVFEKADMANRYPPEIRPFDRYRMRINQVEYHPTDLELMSLAIENEAVSDETAYTAIWWPEL